MKPNIHKLSNGLTVIVIPRESTEFIYMLCKVNVGSKNENRAENGSSHFVEHAVFLGSDEYSKRKILNQMNRLGTSIDAGTNDKTTSYGIQVLKNDAEKAIKLLSQLLLHPTFPEKQIECEKKVILQEIIDTQDEDHFSEAFEELIFKDEGFHMNICGPEENVKSFTAQDLKSFWKKHYTAPNSVLVMCGAIKPESGFRLAEKYFAAMSAKMVKQPVKLPYYGGMPICVSEIQGVNFTLAFNAFDPRKTFARGVISEILGGDFNSRLHKRIRERRGLVYHIGSRIEKFYHADLFLIEAFTCAQNFNKVLSLTCENIREMQEKTVSQRELKIAKQKIIMNYGIIMDNNESCAQFYASSWLLNHEAQSLEEIKAEINQVSATEVQALAHKIFQTPLTYAVEGTYENYIPFKMVQTILRD